MSERATSQWTETLAEAYPITGKKGYEGEMFLYNYLKSQHDDVVRYESDRAKQEAGVDLEVTIDDKVYTIDVKNNVTKNNRFAVEVGSNGWLHNQKKKSKIIWHVNNKTGFSFYYKRSKMISFIIQQSLKNHEGTHWKQNGLEDLFLCYNGSKPIVWFDPLGSTFEKYKFIHYRFLTLGDIL